MEDELDKKARFLKGLVIGLGVLLIVGFIALIAAVGYRVTSSGGDNASPASAADARAPGLRDFGDVGLSLPGGAVIVSIVADGGRLFVLVESPEGSAASRRIIVIDAATGAVLGTVSGGSSTPGGVR